MFTISPLLKTDSYKISHIDMYPEGTEKVYSNFTSRGSRIEGIAHTVHFGLQAYLRRITDDFEAFFNAPKEDVLAEYTKFTSTFVSPGFTIDHIAALHDLGYLPLRFAGAPEGHLIPIKIPSLTVENTHPDFAWLTNYIESDLSAAIWHPSTTATTAWAVRRVLDADAEKSSSTPEAVDFQFHDFSYRGMENWQSAAASSAAHLTSFSGTDAVPAVAWVDYFYPGDNGLVGASVPATEHSVMSASILTNKELNPSDAERESFRRLMNTFPTGILSVVSDTYDFWGVLTEILPQLKDEITKRDGKLVIRPDSGDPVEVITGTVMASGLLPKGNPQQKGAVEVLWDLFGGTINDKGFKELDPHIGLIYGDSITPDRLKKINQRLMSKGFASTNWVAGVGSFTYQYVTRDTFGSAVKATQVVVKGESFDIFKAPKTDVGGVKKSATGRLAVLSQMDGNLYLVEKASPEQEAQSLLQPVWEDGKFLREYSFAEVRENLTRTSEVLTRNGSI